MFRENITVNFGGDTRELLSSKRQYEIEYMEIPREKQIKKKTNYENRENGKHDSHLFRN